MSVGLEKMANIKRGKQEKEFFSSSSSSSSSSYKNNNDDDEIKQPLPRRATKKKVPSRNLFSDLPPSTSKLELFDKAVPNAILPFLGKKDTTQLVTALGFSNRDPVVLKQFETLFQPKALMIELCDLLVKEFEKQTLGVEDFGRANPTLRSFFRSIFRWAMILDDPKIIDSVQEFTYQFKHGYFFFTGNHTGPVKQNQIDALIQKRSRGKVELSDLPDNIQDIIGVAIPKEDLVILEEIAMVWKEDTRQTRSVSYAPMKTKMELLDLSAKETRTPKAIAMSIRFPKRYPTRARNRTLLEYARTNPGLRAILERDLRDDKQPWRVGRSSGFGDWRNYDHLLHYSDHMLEQGKPLMEAIWSMTETQEFRQYAHSNEARKELAVLKKQFKDSMDDESKAADLLVALFTVYSDFKPAPVNFGM